MTFVLPVLETEGRSAKELAGFARAPIANGDPSPGDVQGGTSVPPSWIRDRILSPGPTETYALGALGSGLAELDPGVAGEGALRWPEDTRTTDQLQLWGTVPPDALGPAGSALVVLGTVDGGASWFAYDGAVPAATTALRWPLDVAGFHLGAAASVAAARRGLAVSSLFGVGGNGVTVPYVGHVGVQRLALAFADFAGAQRTTADPCAICVLPTDVPGAVLLDLDAQRLCALADGALVTAWDTVGASPTVYRRGALGTARGAVVTPGVLGSGVRVPNPVASAASFTWYAVVRVDAGAGTSSLGFQDGALFDADISGLNHDYSIGVRADGLVVANLGVAGGAEHSITSATSILGTPTVLTVVRDAGAGTWAVYRDGVREALATGVGSHVLDGPGYVYLGGGGAAAHALAAQYGRVRVYDAVHADADRTRIEAALLAFYGIH